MGKGCEFMSDKKSVWEEILKQLAGILSGEQDWLANLSNSLAILYNNLEEINWAGFYLYRDGELILGPFQGKPACIRIGVGKGVCGSALRDRKTYLVPDVNKFAGHIACDTASRSEIVVPVLKNDSLIGILDIDSPIKERFDSIDQEFLKSFVDILVNNTEFNIEIEFEEL